MSFEMMQTQHYVGQQKEMCKLSTKVQHGYGGQDFLGFPTQFEHLSQSCRALYEAQKHVAPTQALIHLLLLFSSLIVLSFISPVLFQLCLSFISHFRLLLLTTLLAFFVLLLFLLSSVSRCLHEFLSATRLLIHPFNPFVLQKRITALSLLCQRRQ